MKKLPFHLAIPTPLSSGRRKTTAYFPAAVVVGHYPGPDRETCQDFGLHIFALKGEGLEPLTEFRGSVCIPSHEELDTCE
jgi:hypothetical protein